ncbi:YqaJ viral recombinase family protein [Eisenbergiella sp.]|uniref:YqaJ viral recombinase family protein n=1 Tax=Eisenbergiella sp. TaxID=1924109 RepID=UPI002A828B0B|nr:YqaJ viral recombinase family protein [Eisenbergiella sp.]
MEDLAAEIFSVKTGLKVHPVRKMIKHTLFLFMLSDVDSFIDFGDGRTGILECKTTNYNCQNKWANDSVPVNYEYQGRHYMAVMNLDGL